MLYISTQVREIHGFRFTPDQSGRNHHVLPISIKLIAYSVLAAGEVTVIFLVPLTWRLPIDTGRNAPSFGIFLDPNMLFDAFFRACRRVWACTTRSIIYHVLKQSSYISIFIWPVSVCISTIFPQPAPLSARSCQYNAENEPSKEGNIAILTQTICRPDVQKEWILLQTCVP